MFTKFKGHDTILLFETKQGYGGYAEVYVISDPSHAFNNWSPLSKIPPGFSRVAFFNNALNNRPFVQNYSENPIHRNKV